MPYQTLPSGSLTAATSPGAPTSLAICVKARSSRRRSAGTGRGIGPLASMVATGVGDGRGRPRRARAAGIGCRHRRRRHRGGRAVVERRTSGRRVGPAPLGTRPGIATTTRTDERHDDHERAEPDEDAPGGRSSGGLRGAVRVAVAGGRRGRACDRLMAAPRADGGNVPMSRALAGASGRGTGIVRWRASAASGAGDGRARAGS